MTDSDSAVSELSYVDSYDLLDSEATVLFPQGSDDGDDDDPFDHQALADLSTVEYFETLSFQFQSYFVTHVKRALKFFVEATIPKVFEYMDDVLTHGLYYEYASNRLLHTRENRRRLRSCIIFALDELRRNQGIEYEANADVYFIPRIRTRHIDRMNRSWYIFQALRQAGVHGAVRPEIRECLEYRGYSYVDLDLFRLLRLSCIRMENVNSIQVFKINYFE